MENMTDSGLCAVQEIVSKYEESFKAYSENTLKAFQHIWKKLRQILLYSPNTPKRHKTEFILDNFCPKPILLKILDHLSKQG
jgi:hypothetical protein